MLSLVSRMTLLRKIAFGVFVVLALGLGAWAYFGVKNSKKPGVDALTLLPDSCVVYLRSTNFPELHKRLNSRNLIVDKLKLFPDVDQFCGAIAAVDSLLAPHPLLYSELQKATLHFALYGRGNEWLATFNLSQLGIQQEVTRQLAHLLTAKPERGNLYAFRMHGGTPLFFTVESGVVLFGNSGARLAVALDKRRARLAVNSAFVTFRASTQENGLLALYVDHKNYLSHGLAKELKLSAFCSDGFSSGDVGLQPSEVKVNGFLQPGGSNLITALAAEKPQSIEFMNVLPLTTTYFKAMGFDRYLRLRHRADSLWSDPALSVYWQHVNDSALYNLENEFYENLSSNLLEFETVDGQRFVAARVADTARAIEHLQWMCDSAVQENGDSVRRLRLGGEKGLALFSPLLPQHLSYVTLQKGYFIFSNTAQAVLQLQTYFRNDVLLVKDKSFAAYRDQNLPAHSNLLVYASPNQNHEAIRNFFAFDTRSRKDPFENLRHFSFSLRSEENRLRFRLHLLHETGNEAQGLNSLWTLKLDTVSSQKAGLFTNHTNGEKELLLQDDGRQLYLINAKGSVLWKKTINETIVSPLFTVDMFKNKKLQILFSTKNYLHLLDRNGQYVDGYPVKLPAPASGPLSVFDYDNSREYRLFIGCKNNTLYNYNINGKKQDGFSPVRTETEVELPIQYVNVGLSDYLVAVDKEGKIYTFSRRGEGRIGLKNKAVANCSAFYVDATGNINSTYLVYVDDKAGLIHKVSFADKKEIVKLGFDVENAAQVYERVDENDRADLVFTRLSEVIAYDLNGNLLLKKTLPNDLSSTQVYRDQNRFLLLCYSRFRKELLVADQLRQKTQRVPASAPPLVCALFNDGKKYLVTANGNLLHCTAVE